MLPGAVINDRYRVLRQLGEGGMGAVYEAEHVAVGRRVAVKVLHPNFARKPGVVERFEREARAAAAIGHEHIVDVYDFGLHDGAPYMVMEFLRGETLGARLEREGRLGVEAASVIVGQVLSGLGAAHAAGIVHRDLKPDNIFLMPRGGRTDFVKLLDFGISKFNSKDGGKTLTKTGTLMGTPYYMSVEQARAKPDVDGRADLYSVGVILYEMLTGQVPFNADNEADILILICQRTEEPRAPRELDPSISRELDAVVRKAIAHDRDDRYQRAEEMLEALQPFGAGAFAFPELATGSYRSVQLPTSGMGTPTAWAGSGASTRDERRALPTMAQDDAPRAAARLPRWAIPSAALLALGTLATFAAVRGRNRTAPAASASVAPVPSEVSVDLDGLPPGARVWIDGAATDARTFSLPRGSQHQLRVEAQGCQPFETTFSARRSESIHVALAELPAPVVVAPAAAEPAPAAPAVDAAVAELSGTASPSAGSHHAGHHAGHGPRDATPRAGSATGAARGGLLPATQEY